MFKNFYYKKRSMVIKKILIANRSEVSSRIIFSCKNLGIKTVAIYCEQDSRLSYIYQADENHSLKGFGASAYLEQEEIIQIAKKLNVDAIHPGYGFLAENYNFAQKVIDAGLTWIGPNPEIIKSMADKINARNIMKKNGVPIIPGYLVSHNENEKIIKSLATKIGFPLILKDPLGGGGKGIKKVFKPEELIPAFNTVKSESSRLTKSNQSSLLRILMEKYIQQARHIEVQIAGDGKNFIHMFERECSIQRRHQKIIEETPCNFVKEEVLDQIYKAAIKAAKAVKYNNIGTVEFIVTNNNFYFLEMNTRLQVEHSITEQTTGIDLVELQIKIATEKTLHLKQKDIKQNTHSIECRIYSEDPENNFLPSVGKIENLIIPQTPYTRIDHNLEEGMEVTSFFDPMLAKITVWGQNRKKAINNMLTCLTLLKIEGIKTNIEFLKTILSSEKFLSGNIHTQSIESEEHTSVETFNVQESFIEKNNNHSTHEKEIALIIAACIPQKKVSKKTDNKINNWRIQQWQ